MAGDFNRDGNLDLAVLMEDTGEIWIYTGNGNGTFQHTFSIPVGEEATGLSVVPGNGPGLFNLLVGNGFGDVLILDGKGDGTFQIQGSRVSLSVVPDLLGPGRPACWSATSKTTGSPCRPRRQTATSTRPWRRWERLVLVRSSWRRATSQWAFLDQGATLPDAIVVGTGSNSVEVYRTIVHHRRRAHVRPVAGDLLRRHRPGQRHRGRHQRRRHSRHAGRQPGEQRRLRDFRLL